MRVELPPAWLWKRVPLPSLALGGTFSWQETNFSGAKPLGFGGLSVMQLAWP